ncbi:MAG: hypothetical protein RRB13_11350 [bacterium]|nr:hypothetical protein [bacterium]
MAPKLRGTILCSWLLLALFSARPAWAQQGGLHIDYLREVSNELYLSDFQLGSTERIRDYQGHGFALGYVPSNDSKSFWNLEAGSSSTHYKGRIEDGVSVDFSPQAGAGFDALSQSNNIFYEVDLEFINHFVGLAYTNYDWAAAQMRGAGFGFATFGLGVIQQTTGGQVSIQGIDGTEIATAHYQSGIQRYVSFGWSFNYDFLFFDLGLRLVTSPILQIDTCNREAVGETACQRIEAATGNRNLSGQAFAGGVFKVGVFF